MEQCDPLSDINACIEKLSELQYVTKYTYITKKTLVRLKQISGLKTIRAIEDEYNKRYSDGVRLKIKVL